MARPRPTESTFGAGFSPSLRRCWQDRAVGSVQALSMRAAVAMAMAKSENFASIGSWPQRMPHTVRIANQPAVSSIEGDLGGGSHTVLAMSSQLSLLTHEKSWQFYAPDMGCCKVQSQSTYLTVEHYRVCHGTMRMAL